MHQKLPHALLLCSSELVAGCQLVAQPAADGVLVNADFEQLAGWNTPVLPFLTTDQAHSGRYSLRLAPGIEYGPAYRTNLGSSGFVPRRLHLQAWVYVPNGRIRSTVLVVEVDCHGRRPNVWTPFQLEEVVKRYQKWEPVQRTIRLPSDLAATDEVKVYLWHAEKNGDCLWLDDLLLTGEKG